MDKTGFPHISPQPSSRLTLYPSHVSHARTLAKTGGKIKAAFFGNAPSQPEPGSLGNGELVERANNSADLTG